MADAVVVRLLRFVHRKFSPTSKRREKKIENYEKKLKQTNRQDMIKSAYIYLFFAPNILHLIWLNTLVVRWQQYIFYVIVFVCMENAWCIFFMLLQVLLFLIVVFFIVFSLVTFIHGFFFHCFVTLFAFIAFILIERICSCAYRLNFLSACIRYLLSTYKCVKRVYLVFTFTQQQKQIRKKKKKQMNK